MIPIDFQGLGIEEDHAYRATFNKRVRGESGSEPCG